MYTSPLRSLRQFDTGFTMVLVATLAQFSEDALINGSINLL